MHIELTYKSGQTYWEPWPSEFKIDVQWKAKKVHIRFGSEARRKAARLVLTPDAAQRLGQALVLSSMGNVGSIELAIAEKASE